MSRVCFHATQFFYNKHSWPEGPWQDEPDFACWACPQTGAWCVIVRRLLGCWSGHVQLVQGHPWLLRDRMDVNQEIQAGLPGRVPPVHGGITHLGPFTVHEPGISGLASGNFVGFDCAHDGDRAPLGVRKHDPEQRYRNMDYVTAETAKLAALTAEAAQRTPVEGEVRL